jgi:hypothetical protein
MDDIAGSYLQDVTSELRKLKTQADRALAQVPEGGLFATLGEESNSLAVLLQHVGGNLRSRFRDFLTTDGEKPDRRRDAEFEVAPGTTTAGVLAVWETGWTTLFEATGALRPDDLGRTVTIRGEPHSVLQALQRAYGHLAYHNGQIVLLAKHLCGSEWQTLSVPRGGSAALNRELAERAAKAGRK